MAAPESETVKPKKDGPKPEAAKSPAGEGRSKPDATSYVGTPAVGTSKAAPAGGIASVGPEASETDVRRRRLVWCAVSGFLGAWFIAFLRFFLPRTLFEPPTVF